jgi:hypothetical protein
MHFNTTVRLQAEDPTQPLAGLKVELYDRDYFSSDDLLGTVTTDERGEAIFRYNTEDFMSWEERLTGNEFPALYAVVYDPAGERLVSSKADIRGNAAAKFLDVKIPRRPAAEPAGQA